MAEPVRTPIDEPKLVRRAFVLAHSCHVTSRPISARHDLAAQRDGIAEYQLGLGGPKRQSKWAARSRAA